ncbi:hypothetical protein [Streptomyces benahoarensis]|uniref:hypothetical protein n=1 Tax=Streptomyces benahoarensis TaxID=2595054 RepID=UPI00163D9BA8|nr:hypothetical protein [Streptomyces benahoarensis]
MSITTTPGGGAAEQRGTGAEPGGDQVVRDAERVQKAAEDVGDVDAAVPPQVREIDVELRAGAVLTEVPGDPLGDELGLADAAGGHAGPAGR